MTDELDIVVNITEAVTTVVETDSDQILVVAEPAVVEVVTAATQGPTGAQGPDGDAGPQGPPGADGVGDATFRQSFSSATSVVVIHNLGKYPDVVFQDTAGTPYEVEIIYDSLNQLTANWNIPITGTITCN